MDNVPDNELLSAYLDGELTAAEQAEVEQLLAENPAARQLLDEFRALSNTLQALPAHELGEDLGPEVLRIAERRMLTQTPPPDGPSKTPPPARRPILRRLLNPRALVWSSLVVAVAAVLAVVNSAPEDQQRDGPVARGPEVGRPSQPEMTAIDKEGGSEEGTLALQDEAPATADAADDSPDSGTRPGARRREEEPPTIAEAAGETASTPQPAAEGLPTPEAPPPEPAVGTQAKAAPTTPSSVTPPAEEPPPARALAGGGGMRGGGLGGMGAGGFGGGGMGGGMRGTGGGMRGMGGGMGGMGGGMGDMGGGMGGMGGRGGSMGGMGGGMGGMGGGRGGGMGGRDSAFRAGGAAESPPQLANDNATTLENGPVTVLGAARADGYAVVLCDVSHEALVGQALDRLLLANGITVSGTMEEDRLPAAGQAYAEAARQAQSQQNTRRDAAPAEPGRLDLVLVEAAPEQIEATLAALNAQPERFLSVSVQPVPGVEVQQRWNDQFGFDGPSYVRQLAGTPAAGGDRGARPSEDRSTVDTARQTPAEEGESGLRRGIAWRVNAAESAVTSTVAPTSPAEEQVGLVQARPQPAESPGAQTARTSSQGIAESTQQAEAADNMAGTEGPSARRGFGGGGAMAPSEPAPVEPSGRAPTRPPLPPELPDQTPGTYRVLFVLQQAEPGPAASATIELRAAPAPAAEGMQ